jgi:hypothetical protein
MLFSPAYYWSSTQEGADTAFAYAFGQQQVRGYGAPTYFRYCVRAVRSF